MGRSGPGAGQEPIAIVGIGCALPGARGPAGFWELLCSGREIIGRVPESRVHFWRTLRQWPEGHPVRSAMELGGYLDDVDKVDWRSLRISPRDAASMDPQHRLMLEVAWEALDDAGVALNEIEGTNAGVFVGIFSNDYLRMQADHPRKIDGYTLIGSLKSYAANRISYKFDLRGPSVAVDTACASSLMAVHEAVRWLQSGEGELAIAGGVSLLLSPEVSISLATSGILSPTGQCRHLDAGANGFVRTEGAGAVVLKRLADVRPDDRVYAVIRGTAANHNGHDEWIMATNPDRQEELFRRACEVGAVEPKDVDFVEFHGTGTQKGDPIEARAVGNVYGQGRTRPCLVGSVKSNIGHLDTAAGVMGLAKTALALFHGSIPPNRHFKSINPDIPLAELGIEPVTTQHPWPRAEGRRFAAVSAFGLGGSNVHAVLESASAPAARGSASAERPFVLPISAQSSRATPAQAAAWASWLRQATDEQARDACYTAAVRRTHHEHRLAAVAASREELASQLRRSLAPRLRSRRGPRGSRRPRWRSYSRGRAANTRAWRAGCSRPSRSSARPSRTSTAAASLSPAGPSSRR